MTLVVSSWVYTLPKGDRAYHPQMGRRSDTAKAINAYWRCAFCMFASSQVHNPNARHILFCNEPPPEHIDGQSTRNLCERLSIECVPFPSITRPPEDYYPAWNTQFIVLDILDGLTSICQPGDAVLLLDGDVIFTRPLPDNDLERVYELGALTYNMHYPDGQMVNGLNKHDLQALCHTYDPPAKAVTYCGGEFVFLSQSLLPQIADRARDGYQQSIARHQAGQEKFCEEGHLLSWAYASLGIPVGTANHLIHRLWTDRGTYCNVPKDFRSLALWHLPAEKRRGFSKAFSELASPAQGKALFSDPIRLAKIFRLAVPVHVTAVMALRRLLRKIVKRILRHT